MWVDNAGTLTISFINITDKPYQRNITLSPSLRENDINVVTKIWL